MREILAFAPVTCLIVYAVLTKQMAQAMVVAGLLAMAILHGKNFLSGTIDSIYRVLEDPSYQFVLLIMVCFGGMIALLQKSGGLRGFRNGLLRVAAGPKRSMFLAWCMGLLLFADEYLNALTVSFSFREITDGHRIPREHLAFQIQGMACCMCVVVPFSSWTAFIVGLMSEQGLGFQDYLKALPFMFFPLLMILLCLLLALGLFPKVGNLKRAYSRVAAGGPVLSEADQGSALVELELKEEGNSSRAINAVLPLCVLVAGVLMFDNDLIHGLVLALLTQLVLYVGQRLMSVGEFVNCFFQGASSMTTMAIVVCFSFMLSQANRELGLFELLIQAAKQTVSPMALPVVAFAVVGLTTFAMGGCWVVMTVSVPVLIPIAVAVGASTTLVVSAIMSGICLGYCICLYADAVFMTTAGTELSNTAVVRTMMPYTMGLGVVTAACYLLCGALGL